MLMNRGPSQRSAAPATGVVASRFSAGRTASSRPTWPTARLTSSAVGGLMFDTGAPGMPIMLAGYGPKATSSAVLPKPAAATPTAAPRPSLPSRPSA
ncbi:hypothetical protein GCM10027521_02820 [Amycolatopsis cihanbeyliensis]